MLQVDKFETVKLISACRALGDEAVRSVDVCVILSCSNTHASILVTSFILESEAELFVIKLTPPFPLVHQKLEKRLVKLKQK